MKILHLSFSLQGGAGIACLRLHKALLNHGIDSKLLYVSKHTSLMSNIYALKPNDTIFNKIKRKLGLSKKKQDTYRKQFKKLGGDFETISLPFSDYKLHEHPLVIEANIIHLHWVSDFVDYPSFFRLLNKPIVWTLHDMNPFQGIFHYKGDKIRNNHLFEKYDQEIRELKLSLINKYQGHIKFVTPSNWLMQEAINGGFTKNNIRTIPYCLPSNLFSGSLSENFKHQHQISEKDTVLLFVAQSTNVYRKGFKYLLNAIEELKEEDITLLVIGKTELKHHLNKVRYIENDNKLQYYFMNADAVIIPSLEDNLPNVMLEALSSGTPVIGFPTGGLSEHIKQNINGLLTQGPTSKSLAESLIEFIRKKNLFDRNVIKDYALRTFSETSVSKAYIDLYKTIN